MVRPKKKNFFLIFLKIESVKLLHDSPVLGMLPPPDMPSQAEQPPVGPILGQLALLKNSNPKSSFLVLRCHPAVHVPSPDLSKSA